MPPELRKRKAPASEPAPAPPAKKKGPVAKVVAKVKEAVLPEATKTNGATSASKVAVGDTITLEGFGGEIETNDGAKTTLKQLLEESKGGVVLFTYPKASTPGCTTQACLFRDHYAPLTSTGFSIYGLSKDSPKSNTTFKTKQKLPYPLLCDPSSTLIGAIGLKKAPAGTTRGVFVVDKSGKVLAAEPGGPAATVEIVKKLVGDGGDVAPAPVTAPDAAPDAAPEVAPEAAPEAVPEAALEAAPEAPEPKPEVASNGVNGAVSSEETAKAAIADEVATTAMELGTNEAKPVAA